jgi:ferric-dicitrate binding protein FerR (iron transport regulator)
MKLREVAVKTAALLLLPCALLTAQDLHVRSVKGQTDVQPGGITTGRKSQADIEFGSTAGFRLQAESEIRIGRHDGRYRLELVRGSLVYDVISPGAPEVEIVTPSVSVWPSIPGQYEISLNRAAESIIVARAGSVAVVAPAGSEWVDAGQKMIARGPAAAPQFKIVSAIPVWRRLAILMSNLKLGGGTGSDDSGSTDSGSSSSQPAASTATHSSTASQQSSASAAATGSHSGHGK